MRRIFLGLFMVFFLFLPPKIKAADLEMASIRLERNQVSLSPLPILVLLKTKTVNTEDTLKLILGDNWNLEETITVSTIGLPSGVTPLPLISNGIKSSGQTIDFSIGDLGEGVDYGFYITGGISKNLNVGNYIWSVITMANGVEIDMTRPSVPVVSLDQVVVTGKVGALASDFQSEIVSDKNGDLSLNEMITYEISYGSYLKSPTRPLVISATWSRGIVAGSPTPSVDIVDYVSGSGSTAIDGIEPVVDLINRRISWTINTFPANTVNQKVSFQLKVNDSYSGQSRVSFDVETLLNGSNVVTKSSKIINYFQQIFLPTPKVTSVPTISATRTTSSVLDFSIKKVSFISLSDKHAEIKVESNLVPSELIIHYGFSPKNLNKTIVSRNVLATDLINIDKLVSNTEYYFRIEAKSGAKSYFSDMYVFKTAKSSEGSEVDKKSLVALVDNNLVFDAKNENNEENIVVLIPNKKYSLRINFRKPELIRVAQIYVRNSQVLGINSVYGAEPNSRGVDLSEIIDGVFNGHLISPSQKGYYDLILRLENKNGLINEVKIGTLRVIDKFIVQDENYNGIENVKVIFYRYLPKQQIYELMSVQSLGIKNPVFTDFDGTLDLLLPKGKYRAEVSVLGYKTIENDFSIGLGENEVYPTIFLERSKMSIKNWWNYYRETGKDVIGFSNLFLYDLFSSTRFFRLVNALVFLSVMAVFYYYFVKRQRMYWWLLPFNFIDTIKNLLIKRKDGSTWGKVVDKENGLPISGAKVILLDGKLNKILTSTLTDSLGNFDFIIEAKKDYRLTVVKDGYSPSPLSDYSSEGLMAGNIIIKLEKVLTRGKKVGIFASKIGNKLFFWMVMIWISTLFLLEIFFSYKLGLNQTWIWLLVSGINIVAWLKK